MSLLSSLKDSNTLISSVTFRANKYNLHSCL